MLIDWFKFSAALLLLLVPIGLFHGSKVRYRAVSREWDEHWLRIFSLGLHVIDLGRAVLGAWLLSQALTRAPGAAGLMRHGVLLTHAAVFAVAMVLQVFVCKEPDSAHAPFTFAIGLVAGYLPPTVAGFAIVFAIVIATGARLPVALFPLLAVSVAAAGFLFHGKKLLLPVSVVALAVVLPVLLSLLFSRRLVVSYRARRGSDTRATSELEAR